MQTLQYNILYSTCGTSTGIISTTWELVKNEKSGVSSYETKIITALLYLYIYKFIVLLFFACITGQIIHVFFPNVGYDSVDLLTFHKPKQVKRLSLPSMSG
jgi:hypothetical protein